RGRGAEVEPLTPELPGDAVVVVLELDVVVDADLRTGPERELVRPGWQRTQGLPLDRLEELAPRLAEVAAWAGVEALEQERDRRPQVRRPRRLARLLIDDREAGTAGVDEALLARPMDLPHREREALRPGRVPRAELAVLVAVGGLLAVLLPEELLGYVGAAKLPMDRRPVRLRPRAHRVALVGEEQPLECRVV